MEIELDSVRSNVKEIKKYIGNGVHLMAVVKANAYEFGVDEVTDIAISNGATWLGVATLDEALALRTKVSQNIPILVLGYASPQFISLARRHRITLTAISLEWVKEADRVAKENFDFHLKIDTGMNRLGIKTLDELRSVVNIVSNNRYMNWTGAFTHFASAEDMKNQTYYNMQLALFEDFVRNIPQRHNKLIHCANSGAALLHKEKPFFDMVRIGFGLLGKIDLNASLVPLQRTKRSLYTTLVLVKQLNAGEGVGYGQLYVTTTKQWIGTIPIGRWDGWDNFNTTEVLIEGTRVRIVGHLGLNHVMLALPKAYPVGTTVTFIESSTSTLLLSPRLPRIYRSNGRIVSIRNAILDSVDFPSSDRY